MVFSRDDAMGVTQKHVIFFGRMLLFPELTGRYDYCCTTLDVGMSLRSLPSAVIVNGQSIELIPHTVS